MACCSDKIMLLGDLGILRGFPQPAKICGVEVSCSLPRSNITDRQSTRMEGPSLLYIIDDLKPLFHLILVQPELWFF